MKILAYLRDLLSYAKYSLLRFCKAILYIISPAYRIGLKNQKILSYNHLMLQDIRRESMPLDTEERLVSEDVSGIDTDHLKRYQFAKNLIKDGDNVLDIACGIGYGSYVMSENTTANFTGVDVATGAIKHANKYFKRDNIEFICSRAEVFQPKKQYDVIVSFETIEHLEYDEQFIEAITKHLKQGGMFICSTPNELMKPYSIIGNPFHYRHYTPRQMSKLLRKKGGLKTEAIYTQRKGTNYDLTKTRLGKFTVHVARKI